MSLFVSFLSGLVAAFTPCVIVLMPMLLYRFFHEDTRDYKNFILFLGGFILLYIVFGYFLSTIFTSFVQNGFKLGVGLLFVVLGILAVFGRLNPINFPIIKNPIAFGGLFALIISLNPCTIPYLSVIVSINNNLLLFLNLIIFGLGIIMPAIFFAFFGKKVLDVGKKSGKVFYKIGKLMHYVLIASGLYLIFTIEAIQIYDIYVITFFLGAIFFILLKSFFIIGRFQKNFSLRNILLFSALFLMLLGAFSQCKSTISNGDKYAIFYGQSNLFGSEINNSCDWNINTCEVCQRCIRIFLGASMIGFLGIFLFYFRDLKKE